MDVSDCPIKTTMDVIGGKWKPLILYALKDGPRRFGALRRAIPAATQKMLTDHLRELERDGIVHREVFAEIPPRVEYSLTAYGVTLKPALSALAEWGLAHRERAGKATAGRSSDPGPSLGTSGGRG